MPGTDQDTEQTVRETAYFIWEREGRPEGRDQDHWQSAIEELGRQHTASGDAMDEEEKILASRTDVNLPALLTRDVPGG